MKNIPLAPVVVFAAALVGFADSLYLAYASYTGSSLSCSILEGCDVVARSPYAFLFDIPLSYLGLIYYAYLLPLAVLLMYDPYSRGMCMGALLYGAVGLGFSLYFEFLQLFVIDAICIYCLISALMTLVIFGAVLRHFVRTRNSIINVS